VSPASTESQAREACGVPAPTPPVEVGRRGPDCDEADVHVEAVADAGHVAEQAAVTVNGVGGRLARDPDDRPRRQASLRDG
jgi:hypothetical protein